MEGEKPGNTAIKDAVAHFGEVTVPYEQSRSTLRAREAEKELTVANVQTLEGLEVEEIRLVGIAVGVCSMHPTGLNYCKVEGRRDQS